MDGLVKTLGTVLLLLAATLWAAVLLLVPAALVKFCWGYLFCVLLRASDRRGTKECLQYTLDAINTEEAACEAKKQAAEHYTEFELFDVRT